MTEKKKILIVVGTRPNFIKVTQFKKFNTDQYEFRIVHTGQHYDEKMASSFFDQLRIEPDFYLNVAAASANTQIANIMIGLERVCKEYSPHWIIAVGDVNSTLAAALTANKLNIRLAHLESGLRSFDRTMPEEHNRTIADALADVFFVTEQSGVDNLVQEGKPSSSIHFVGNTMIDTLVAFDPEIRKSDILQTMGVRKGEYVLMTMHRPSNVDTKDGLMRILKITNHFSEFYKIIFPVHPRTRNKFKEYELDFEQNDAVILTEPKDYFSFQKLILDCAFVITDSGGIQEETTFRGIPCYTLRPNTERPSTVTDGSNTLVVVDQADEIIKTIGDGKGKPNARIPLYWDGNATRRIVEILLAIS